MSDAQVNAGAGRVAVVTGAARGIGQAIALRLAEAGHRLALGDMRPAEETAKQVTNGGGDALSVPCDLGSAAGWTSWCGPWVTATAGATCWSTARA